jgi:hypothetical protein
VARRAAAAALILACVLAGSALAATGGQPQKKHTAADMARAQKIVLHMGDVGPGWVAKPAATNTGSGTPRCKNFNPDESDLVETGNADSPSFQMSVRFVSSSVSVYKTAAQAQMSWNRVLRPELPGCLGSLVAKGATANGVPTKVVGSGPLTVPRLAPRTAAFRIRFTATSQGLTLNGSVDLYLLGKSRVDAILISVSFGSPPTADELRLARVVASRL